MIYTKINERLTKNGGVFMKKKLATLLLTVTLVLTAACSSNGAIPKPGDPDFIGPLPADMVDTE